MMREKLTQEEEEFKTKHIFKQYKRSHSMSKPFTSSYTKRTILKEPENDEGFFWAFDHPTKSYKKFVREHALNDLERIRLRSGTDVKVFKSNLRKERPYRHLRVQSQQDLYRSKAARFELKPKGTSDLRRLNEADFNIKLCDMGNACYINKHYSDVIQTREYRSPEVILEGEYDESADLWSLACMVFELVTGDYLFDPKKGKTYKKNDDHLALISELIGEVDDIDWLFKSCDAADHFYTSNGKLKRIKQLKPWPL